MLIDAVIDKLRQEEIAELRAEIKRLKAENEALKGKIQFYADLAQDKE